jgi:hypothetical protein
LLVVAVVAVGAEVEAEASREGAEAFLAVEAVFRGEVAISLLVREVFPAAAAITFSPEAAIFLLAILVPLVAEPISPVLEAEVFPEVVIVIFPTEMATILLDITVFRRILRCSPISEGRARVVDECPRIQPGFNQAAIAHRWEEAQQNYHPAIGGIVKCEIGPHNFPLATKRVQEHVEVIFNLNS